MMEHREYEELATLDALDALDTADKRKLDEHLETCSACRLELVELRDAAGLLAHASTPAEPSAEVRARILSEARREARPSAASSPVVTQFRPLAATRPWPLLLRLAAALAFVVLALGFVGMWLSGRHEQTTLTYQLKVQREELDREREARRQEQEVLALLTSRDAKAMQLSGTQSAQNARAMFVFDQKSGRAVLMTEGLPLAPPEKAYAIWFIPKGHSPMPGKVFKVDPSGHAMMMDQMPPEAMENAVIAITLEPEKGSASPTGPIYLASSAS